MPVVLYLHGFLSSPQSHKAQVTHDWLQAHRPGWRCLSPALSSQPGQARAELDALMADWQAERPCLIGSSLGGFWATYLSERHDLPCVLINPAVSPHTRFADLVGQPLKNYHTGAICTLDAGDLAVLADCDRPQITHPERYWLMVQTGDETLDYRQAVARYRECRQTVMPGGSHAFDGYEDRLPEIAGFFESFSLGVI